jgi:predicted extracellular nuclease
MKFLFSIVITLACSPIAAQMDTVVSDDLMNRPAGVLRVGFWNQENLFDVVDDSLTNDEDFTPAGNHAWNEGRYYSKLMNMSKTIAAIGGWEPIDVLGLCEVENRLVVRELIERTPLREAGYEVVHYNSPDNRGIDVALIYRKARFTLIHSEPIPVRFPEEGARPTRDILYVKGLALGKDTLHIFINHWPSRLGGAQASEPKRMLAAGIVRHKVDSIYAVTPNAAVVITGDFNDHPEDRSINETLAAGHDRNNLADNSLFNLMHEKEGKEGTHKYQGHWGILDQVIVTCSMLKENAPVKVYGGKAHIFIAPWLLTEDPQYTGHQLLRTYVGPRYVGGFSDHLPVFVDLELSRP